MRPTDPPRHTLPADRPLARSARELLRLAFSRRGHTGPPSDHFDGRRFHNLDRPDHHGLLGFLRWRLGRLFGVDPWPRWTDSAPGPAPPGRVEGDALRVTFVGHATVLLQTAGLNVLTDPMWSERQPGAVGRPSAAPAAGHPLRRPAAGGRRPAQPQPLRPP
jgi:hypothetical protein